RTLVRPRWRLWPWAGCRDALPHDIDETVLPSLTHQNLKELGVASLGHRVKLLDAIAALRSDASGKTLSADTTTTSSAPSAHPEDRAERRQVTVMFSDLVGSTALSARMDPEDLREIISAYHRCIAETVQRFGNPLTQRPRRVPHALLSKTVPNAAN